MLSVRFQNGSLFISSLNFLGVIFKFIFSDLIHTVGPQVHREVSEEQRNLLKSCYIESLNIATANNLRTIVCNSPFQMLPDELKSNAAMRQFACFHQIFFVCFDVRNFRLFHVYRQACTVIQVMMLVTLL